MINPGLILGLMFKSPVNPENILNYRIYTMVLPLIPVIMMSLSFFPSINRGKIGSVIALSRQLFLYVPVMMILPRMFGVRYVYIGSFLIDAVMTLATGALMAREFKRLRNNEVESIGA